MTDVGPASARQRLDAALSGLATTFRGMTARPDEHNCECHWGSAEDLARLKEADTELDPDLLHRTWRAIDWSDHPAVLRRILPQFATALVDGSIEPLFGLEEAGRCFALGHWRRWPAEQAAAVEEFLAAWWVYTLTAADAPVLGHQVLALSVEASGTLTPWLRTWETVSGPVADRRLAEAVARWERDLLGDELPWDTWEDDEEETREELTAWLVRHAPARLRAHGADEELLHRVRLLGLTGPDRWEDPHWPAYVY
ncbi:hypothetical protein [Streptomyces olivochromogenes]|uniref:hypothetical protein n=1 Tax=Streptomyces olivochromogenes TaxID=1963 RepID=UPI001F1EE69C|nr:hypothetical protein [Streptomyces olivochromogenes]MCF3130325.1 hypothetical protein [Streptomyces olivochromogenes]